MVFDTLNPEQGMGIAHNRRSRFDGKKHYQFDSSSHSVSTRFGSASSGLVAELPLPVPSKK